MKTKAFISSRFAAFTMIEMIGVLAVMAIIASILVPNGVRAIDRASVAAESKSMHNLGEQVKLYLKARGAPPGLTTPVKAWNVDLADFADLSPADVLTNSRQNNRSYVYEPGAIPKRVLIISSMRDGLALPTSANLNTLPRFNDVWDVADRSIPPVSGNAWAGWVAWRNVSGGGDFLVIERVNLNTLYLSAKITLENLTGRTPTPPATALPPVNASFDVLRPDGTSLLPTGRQTINATVSYEIPQVMYSGCRVLLYATTAAPTPVYRYVINENGATFEFNGSYWNSK